MLNESMMMMMMVRRMGYNKSNSVGMMMIVGAGVVGVVMASWWNESLPCPMT